MEKYESLGLVGKGSYGVVTKCRNRETGRIVAVKRFLESEDDETVKKIAQREVRLLKQLKHENLVNLLEVWKKKRRWYLVFEFVERSVLDELEQFPNGLPPSRTRRYLYQVLLAITFCHQHNIVHRDIKPENVLVSQCGVIKVCDFGFARVMSAVPGEAYTDYVATRWYRAPELLLGDTTYDKAVDVWAIGCLFVEMMTGVPLFPGDSDIDQLSHIIRCFGSLTPRHQQLFCRIFCGVSMPEPTNREPLHTRFPQLTGNTADITQKCLQMDPEKRPPCSQLLNHDLFTSDGFHIRFTSGSTSVSNADTEGTIRRNRDDLMQKTNSDIIQREEVQCPTEGRSTDQVRQISLDHTPHTADSSLHHGEESHKRGTVEPSLMEGAEPNKTGGMEMKEGAELCRTGVEHSGLLP
ncbi:cyclin-dependent kinase-like 2 [Brachyhypopomus gauderio]|uniref:cyclin-dependent kinase-like 2 n=1 Tax=Brachyhypopomus gauderio TaxID=698409 RepID=UPI0040427743